MEQNHQKILENDLLVIRCQQGEHQAFSALVNQWQTRLCRYAVKITGSTSAAHDIVQETWYAVVKGLGRLDDASVFPCWVFRLLHNKCVDWIRKEQRQSQLHKNLEENHPQAVHQETNHQEYVLHLAMNRLTPDRKALILLRYREEFSVSQIADILNIPVGTVKSRLHRTINELRQLMEGDDYE